MIDVSILTYWGVPNYGAWTQAYALTSYLNSLNNVSARQLAYLEQSHDDIYYINDLRLKNSFSYSWNIIPHTFVESVGDLEKRKYDVYITGADSIWSFEGNTLNKDLHLMGIGIDAKKKVSYAPSADRLTVEELSVEMIDGISSYDYLSVRDEYTKKILEESGVDKKIEIVIDPALLWDFTTDNNIVFPIYEDYIAVYGAHWDEDFIKMAQEYGRKYNLKLISLGYKNDWCDMSIKMNELRAVEWIGFIGKANAVITSTFHGLMVGINYGKKVILNQVISVANRSETLRKDLNAKSLEIPNAFEFQKEEYVDRLVVLRNKASDYIKRALLDGNE